MINADMREYNYYLYGAEDEYGQPSLSADVQGSFKMAIYSSSTEVQNNIIYTGASYVGFTYDEVTDKAVIAYGDKLLKVLYVLKPPSGRLHTQVFMGDMQ
jgi:hypothetical protein